ncbi:P-loop containing nucleoside triphosphate hydrolase protein [Gongronella butleri]|nr:P-loop containing nucleoside triphosphate hydrolase protein [Gongronella butleri]
MTDYIARCYGDEGERLVQLLSLAFDTSSVFSVEPILVSGPTGVGKSYTLDLLAAAMGCRICRLTLGDLAADYDGRLSLGLEKAARKAALQPKAILVLEDIDLLFPRYADAQDVGLLPCLTRCAQRHASLVIVGTTRQSSHIRLDAKALFHDTIHLGIPTPHERAVMLQHLLSAAKVTLDAKTLAAQAHAFTAANLAHWYRIAQHQAASNDEQLSARHFEQTRENVPLSTQGFMAEKPDPVTWDQVGGLATVKQALEESAVWVYKHADAYARLGVQPCRGVLLHGPPGTGKTLLAKAVATESDAHFLPVRVPDLIKSEVGESEKALVQLFETARRCQPSVVFLDEVDAIFSTREHGGEVSRKLISQFLVAMDHLPPQVMLLAATNHADAMDPALLSPGRFDRLIYVGAPDVDERGAILTVLARAFPLDPAVDLATVAGRTQGYTGADLKAVLRRAALLALKRDAHTILASDIDTALTYVTPSTSSLC